MALVTVPRTQKQFLKINSSDITLLEPNGSSEFKSSRVPDCSVTMIGEFFIHLLERAKKAAKALKVKVIALLHKVLPPIIALKALLPGIPLNIVQAMHISRRYRLTSDHSPIFSLYTFFPDCQ